MTKTVARRLVPDTKAVKAGGDMRAWLDAAKAPSRLITPIERHLLTRQPEPRSTTVLHPSDLIAADWCERAAYHLLRGAEPKQAHLGLRTQTIFDEGHNIHGKWQRWLNEMGHLYGRWECLACGWTDWATSPLSCNSCTRRLTLRYREVPLASPAHRIEGHADGWVTDVGDDCLIEIKSIGLGTVRMEAPALLAKADGDLQKLWDSIRRPFGKHLRQGQMYLALARIQYGAADAPKEIVFLYENKMNQAAREFVVSYDPQVTAQILDSALDVVWAVDHDREPDCSNSDKGCPRCKQFAA